MWGHPGSSEVREESQEPGEVSDGVGGEESLCDGHRLQVHSQSQWPGEVLASPRLQQGGGTFLSPKLVVLTDVSSLDLCWHPAAHQVAWVRT